MYVGDGFVPRLNSAFWMLQLDAQSREWLVVSSQANYHALAKLAAGNPRLARFKVGTVFHSRLYRFHCPPRCETAMLLSQGHDRNLRNACHNLFCQRRDRVFGESVIEEFYCYSPFFICVVKILIWKYFVLSNVSRLG